MFTSTAPCQAVTVETATGIDVLVGCRVWSLRHQRGVSLKDISSAIGVAPEVMAAYESGRARIDASTLFAITRALAVQPADVFGE
jgi:transcriptional regulator with XRE-family HTH domain